MTAAGTQLSSFLTNRIQRIEVSATMAVAGEAEKLRAKGADLVDFGAGEPHYDTPEHIKEAAIAAIRNNFTKYTAVGGTAELRDAICMRHATDFGSDYKREDCIVSTGGKHALFNAIQVLVDHGDEVILPVPYWVSFKDIVRYAGGEPVYIATDERHDFALTADMVERAITPRTKVIILNSPNNPSGSVMKPEDMAAVLRLAHDRGIYVVSDECYVYLNHTGQAFSAGCVHEVKERLIIIGSLSKTYAMTGWRLGYALGPGADYQRHVEAAESEHVEFNFHRSESSGGGADRLTGLREADAGRLHQAARPGCGGTALDSRPHLRRAEWSLLCLSERQPLF